LPTLESGGQYNRNSLFPAEKAQKPLIIPMGSDIRKLEGYGQFLFCFFERQQGCGG
jgi:hypothetical protein